MPRLFAVRIAAVVSLWIAFGVVAQPRIVPGTPGAALPEPRPVEPEFTIAILPDRTTGRDWGLAYLEQAVEDLNRIDPDAIFTVGDMVQGYTRSMERYLREVAQYKGIVEPLEAPLFTLPGNHDVISGFRDPSDRRFEKAYQAEFGPLYYAAYFDLMTVIALHSDEQLQSRPELSEEQATWARARIDEAMQAGRPIVVMMHKPLWRYRGSGWEPVHEKLAEAAGAGLRVVVVAGHFHAMQRDADRDGVQYHIVGTCGGMIDQHPLAGQLQHLTFVRAKASGEVAVYHQAVGCTLPDDFIAEVDQTRSFQLKTYREVLSVEGVLEQPVERPVSGTVELKVTNVIDVPIRVTAELVKRAPEPALVPGYSFYSRTSVDTFIPETTDVDTPFEQTGPVEPVEIAPGETATIPLSLRCDAQGRMVPPPPINATATFVDSKGREVPVVLRARVPLAMRYHVGPTTRLDMPISAWEFSVYELPEPDPMLGLSVDDDSLNVSLLVQDDVPCYDPQDTAEERVENPQSDAVRIRIGEGDGERHYLIEPLGPASTTWEILDDGGEWVLREAPQVTWQRITRESGYGLVVELPLELVGEPGRPIPFNVEVADNDETYHTQWRSWSARGAGSVIVLPARP